MLYWLYLLASLFVTPRRGVMTARRYFTANLEEPVRQTRIKKRFKLEAYLRARAFGLRHSPLPYSDETQTQIPQKHILGWTVYFLFLFAGLLACGHSFDSAVDGFLYPRLKPIEQRIRYGTVDNEKIKRIEREWLFRPKTESEELGQIYADLFWVTAYP